MLGFFRRLKRSRRIRKNPLDAEVWRQTLADHPILRGLTVEEGRMLLELTTHFLAEKQFYPLANLDLNLRRRASIAAQSCLPILQLGLDWYEEWTTVVVFPAEFMRPRSEFDAIGVQHEWDEVLSGESWERGPVILSWADVEASGWGDGYNVVIHEMAHKLDELGGDSEGFPPLHRDMRVRDWTVAFRSAFDDLNAIVERGAYSPIDAYAAENPAEFFAVTSELFFEQPGLLHQIYPDVYAQLQAFFRQNPLGRLQ